MIRRLAATSLAPGRRAVSGLTAKSTTTAPASLPGNAPLSTADPEIAAILEQELRRQADGLELIASENFTSRAVLECLGSVATNKYAEGLPGARYYGGTAHVDALERLCQRRAMEAFRLNEKDWGVNVQPYSGSPANFATLTALLKPHDRIMGLDLPCGGHLTHGFYTAKKKVSATSVYFESLAYKTGPDGLIDFADLESSAMRFRPQLIIAGGSAYPREWDYRRFREICDKVGALFMVDMAHFSGLVATQEHASPFDFADVVTTTTHKTLRGPRSGMAFARRALFDQLNQAVFPALQGGPHMHQIAGVACQMKEVMTPEFKEYVQQVKANCKAMSEELVALDHNLVTGGSDNHLVLWNLRPRGVTGSKAERLLEYADITVNKNSVPGDKSAITPGGLRLGTPALTTRGMKEPEFKLIAQMLDEGVRIAVDIQKQPGCEKLAGFATAAQKDERVAALKKEVVILGRKFPFPGLEKPFPTSPA